MQVRRTVALATGALVLVVPTLSSCTLSGRDVATAQEYTPAVGANNRDATVDVLGAVIVSATPGSGTFVATFVNNDAEADAEVGAIAAPGEAEGVRVREFEPIQVPARGYVNLADGDEPIQVRADDLEAGRYVQLEVTLGDGQTVPLEVPVVANHREFEGLDSP